jgi:hypothetical protein
LLCWNYLSGDRLQQHWLFGGYRGRWRDESDGAVACCSHCWRICSSVRGRPGGDCGSNGGLRPGDVGDGCGGVGGLAVALVNGRIAAAR